MRFKSRWSVVKRLRSISLLVMDCDGTMTDGDVNHRRFDVHDGYGLMNLKIPKAIISGYAEEDIYKRAKQLDIDYAYLGVSDKAEALEQLVKKLGIEYEQVCYIGDDLNDLECIRKCGVGIAVHDAAREIRKAADWITKNNGGHGAIRELTDMMR